MSIGIAIFGLMLLVLIHEFGHFVAARAVGMTPRKFYVGFGKPLAKFTRGGVEYGFGWIPLGGYVKIPGMNRPSPGELTLALNPGQRERYAAELALLDTGLNDVDDPSAPVARQALESLRPTLGSSRAWQELEMALAPDAYWRQATWRRLVAIGAGPAVNVVFAMIVFIGVFLVSSTILTRHIDHVIAKSPAARAGLHANDEVLTIGGRPVPPTGLAKRIRATQGRPFVMVVVRHGKRLTVGPLRAKLDQGAYRIGIVVKSREGGGESFTSASRDAGRLSWDIVSGTVVGISHVLTGRDTRHVSSAVGIVRESGAAWRQGLHDFLYALGVISLALGAINLLPILPLDGGHIVIALIEKARGKTFRQSVYVRYSAVGLSLFLFLMYFGLRNDIFGSN